MKKLLIFTSILETALGILLVLVPVQILKILLGIESDTSVEVLSRLTGLVYICFGIACYPGSLIPQNFIRIPAVRSMLVYNFFAAVYLGYLKFVAGYTGQLLFPAVILHALITIIFIYLIATESKSKE